jgi:hypothetical protein
MMSLYLIRSGAYPCVYCGETATSVDHVPPILLKNEVTEKDRFCVPSCLECNCTLEAKPLFTVLDRQIWLRLHYRKKYAKILRSRDRSEAELQEYGYTLRTVLEAASEQKRIILARLSFRITNLDDFRFEYYASSRSSKDGSSFLGQAGGLPEAFSLNFSDALADLIQNDMWINGKCIQKDTLQEVA